MAKKRAPLSDQEWKLMNIAWVLGKSTARQIYDETLKEKQRGYQTIKTMLDRLVGKGYLQREKLGPLCLYQPAVQPAQVRSSAVDRFVDTVLGNTFAPLFAHFAKGEKLSTGEIEQLKALIEKSEADNEADRETKE